MCDGSLMSLASPCDSEIKSLSKRCKVVDVLPLEPGYNSKNTYPTFGSYGIHYMLRGSAHSLCNLASRNASLPIRCTYRYGTEIKLSVESAVDD